MIKPISKLNYCDPTFHLYVVKVNFREIGQDRVNFMIKLKSMGIGTQVHYIPIHTQPYWKNKFPDLNLPGAEEYYSNCLTLPLYPSMKDEEVYYVVKCLKKIINI